MTRRVLVLVLLLSLTSAQQNIWGPPPNQKNPQQGFNQNGFNQQGQQWSQQQQVRYRLGMTGQQQMKLQQGYGVIPTSKSAVIPNANSPSKLSSTTVNGAQVDIQIKGYSNPNNLVSNTTTCACTTNCAFLQSDQQNACKFSFVTIISSADQSVQYYSTDFFSFNQQMDPRVGNWSNPMSFQMTSKPVAIDIFVYQMGVAMTFPDASRQQLLQYFDKLMLVDSFIVDVFNYDATDGLTQNEQLNGKMLGTSMSVSWSVKCINNMMGKNCNLICGVTPDAYAASTSNPYAQNGKVVPPLQTYTSSVLCKDTNGVYSQCQYNAGRTQATNCVTCINGATPDGTCNGIYTEVTDDSLVSYAFRTWTIVLGCLLGLAVLLIICLIITYIIVRNRAVEKEEYKNGNPYPITSSTTAASRPLLEDEWTLPPARRTTLPPPPAEHDRASDDSYRVQTVTVTKQQRQEHQV